jgi:hypothetical protein
VDRQGGPVSRRTTALGLALIDVGLVAGLLALVWLLLR